MKPTTFIILVLLIALSLISPWAYNNFLATDNIQKIKNNPPNSASYAVNQRSRELHALLQKHQFEDLQAELEKEQKKGFKPWDGGSYLTSHIHYWVNDMEVPESLLIGQLTKWLMTYPSSAIAYAYRGTAYEQYAWKARGSKYATDTSKKQFKDMKTYFDKGYPDLMRAIHLDPTNTAALFSLAGYLFNTSPRENYHFIGTFRDAIKQQPTYYGLYHRRLITLLEKWKGQEGDAMAFARKVAGEAEEGSPLKLLIVAAHREEGMRMARKYKKRPKNPLSLLFGGQPDFDPSIQKRGDYYKQPVVWDEISTIVKEVLNHHPDFSYAMLLYAELAYDAGKKANAIDYYIKAAALDPYYGRTADWRTHALIRLGYFFKKQKVNDKALPYLETYIRFFPEKKSGYDYAAHIYSTNGEYKKSVPYYKKLVELDPEKPRYLSSYCGDLYHINDLTQAMDYCNKAIALDPEYAHAYDVRSYIKQKTGDMDGAKQDAETYSRLKKNKKKK